MKYALFALLAFVTLYLTLNVHSRTGIFTYKSELYGDKAGYYIYLPSTFIWGFDGGNVPNGLPDSVGNGFSVTDHQKIRTKYPVGVATMLLPFFLVTHYAIAPSTGDSADGFGPAYHKMVDIAAWVYLLLGLLVMAKVLGEYFKPPIVWATIMAFLLGSSLFYYYSVESGMSHIYSFFLVTLLLRGIQVVRRKEKLTGWMALGLGVVIGLLLITRFTNAILLSLLLAWEVSSVQEFKTRLGIFFRSPVTLLMLIGPVLLLGMQMAYYLYLSGNPFYYSYDQEGFNFAQPQLLKVWFSPLNGLFSYAPVMVLAMVGLVRMLQQRIAGGWYVLGIFFLISYVFASWWQWSFGCAYGARSYVEYYPLFMVPFGYLLQWIDSKGKAVRAVSWTLIAAVCIVAVKTSYLYKLCFFGTGEWDWAYWWGMVTYV